MKRVITGLFLHTILLILFSVSAQNVNKQYIELKGQIVDSSTNTALSYCNILVEGHNIATVSNTYGEYILKIPEEYGNVQIIFKHLGYKNKLIDIKSLLSKDGKISLIPSSISLPEIDVIMLDANLVVKSMFTKIADNYPQYDMFTTAFYRESIRNRHTYVSLSEAVVDIKKMSYKSNKMDIAKLYKARKQTDYSKLDTLAFKLMGGPLNNIYLDIIKFPEIVFTEDIFDMYFFIFDRYEWMDDKIFYVINFEHKYPQNEVSYNGKLYIDANSLALKTAIFSLDLKKSQEATQLFIKKKPLNAKVTPIQANYRIDYVEKDAKWHYAYSRIELGMKVNWKKKLFNTIYYTTVEMAVTDQTTENSNKTIKFSERLKSNVIISEAADGFADPDFWGEHNIIEPEKSIENAIKKIKKQLDFKTR